MQTFKILVAVVAGLGFVGLAHAGQSTFGKAADGVVISYDDTQWEAAKMVGNPFFTCSAPDCGTASCMVMASLNPDFAAWPDKVDEASLAALQDIFVAYEKDGGHDDAAAVAPMQAMKIGSHDILYVAIGTKAAGGLLSTRYMIREAGDTRIVTCEGDADSLGKLKPQIDALVGGITFYQQ